MAMRMYRQTSTQKVKEEAGGVSGPSSSAMRSGSTARSVSTIINLHGDGTTLRAHSTLCRLRYSVRGRVCCPWAGAHCEGISS